MGCQRLVRSVLRRVHVDPHPIRRAHRLGGSAPPGHRLVAQRH